MNNLSQRFRGFLPVVVDVECGGFNADTDALLEIAAVPIELAADGMLEPGEAVYTHVIPFPGANLEKKALEFTGIDPFHPLRAAREERAALDHIFAPVRTAVKKHGCQRAILVGHNAFFDLSFLNAAIKRTQHKRSPFHPFSTLDTVSLAALAYGQTVLAKAVRAAGMEWDSREAHSAVYDTRQTALLFCKIVNRWTELNGWPGQSGPALELDEAEPMLEGPDG
jgi:ribonuclease T